MCIKISLFDLLVLAKG